MSAVVPLKRQPRFRVVPTVEQDLAALFAREAVLLGDLAEVRAEIDAARGRYAEKHDLLAKPRTERLRTMLSPPKSI